MIMKWTWEEENLRPRNHLARDSDIRALLLIRHDGDAECDDTPGSTGLYALTLGRKIHEL